MPASKKRTASTTRKNTKQQPEEKAVQSKAKSSPRGALPEKRAFDLVGWVPYFTSWDGRDDEEKAARRRVVAIDWTIVASSLIGFFLWSRSLEDLPLENAVTTGFGHILPRLALGFVQFWIVVTSFYYQPGPSKAFPDYWTVINKGGRIASFFTSQTILIHTVYFISLPVAHLLRDLQWLNALNILSLWAAMQGVVLTVLFTFLNWREPKWNIMCDEMESKFPGWTSLMAFTHFPQALMSGYDFFLCNKTATLETYGMSIELATQLATAYGIAYSAWIFFMADVWGGMAYPFIQFLNKWYLRVAFGGVVTLAALTFMVGLHWLKVNVVQDRLIF